MTWEQSLIVWSESKKDYLPLKDLNSFDVSKIICSISEDRKLGRHVPSEFENLMHQFYIKTLADEFHQRLLEITED